MSENILQLDVLRNAWRGETKRQSMLHLQLQAQDKMINKLQEEKAMLHQQLMSPCNHPLDRETLLEFVVPTLLWKVTDSPDIAEFILSGKDKLLLLFDLTQQNLDVYSDLNHLFRQREHELDLLISLVGFLANITELKKGTHQMLNDENGCKVIQKFTALLQQMDTVIPKTETQNSLKTMLLKLLNNVSLDNLGFEILKKNFCFVDALCKNILTPTQNQCRTLELTLVHSLLTYKDCNVYKRTQTILSYSELVQFAKNTADCEISMLVNCILNQYQELSNYFNFD